MDNIEEVIKNTICENLKFEGNHVQGDVLEISVSWDDAMFTSFLIQLEGFYRRE